MLTVYLVTDRTCLLSLGFSNQTGARLFCCRPAGVDRLQIKTYSVCLMTVTHGDDFLSSRVYSPCRPRLSIHHYV